MKAFFASLLGTLAALFVACLGLAVLALGFIGVAASMGKKPVAVEKGSYLVFDLTADIRDAPLQPNPFAFFESLERTDAPKALQLRTVTKALRAAAADDRIRGVFLTGRMAPSGYGSSLAALREVRAALAEVKAAGKPVLAYFVDAGLREAYLGSVANEIVLDPYGQMTLLGLASEPIFFAKALEKLGIGVQLATVGRYKSANEPFTRNDLSAENREQLQALLDDLWVTVRDEIAQARDLAPAALQKIVDEEGYLRPEAAKKHGLVTRVAYRDEVLADLKSRTGKTKAAEAYAQVTLAAYARVARDPQRPGPAVEKGSGSEGRIAVLYAEGAIVDGEGGPEDVGGTRFARELRRLRQDDRVKAIVLRVNSPGGSATASEHILREARLAREAKPVIVSMGGYAASGGYWISCFASRIFAEPTTITGSIGVAGILIDVEHLAERLGVGFDSVKTGRFADLGTISRPKTPEELAIFRREAGWIYDEFRQRVAEGRGLTAEKVADLAEGRVWSGEDAKASGLVDELGGLDAAIRHAATAAGLGERYRVLELPRPRPFAEILTEALESMPTRVGASSPLAAWVAGLKERATVLFEFNDPRRIYARLPVLVVVP
jgi:protease IV